MAQEIVVGHRYGILRGEWGQTKTDGEGAGCCGQGGVDPYGIEIDYYDRVTKVQGRVKLMTHQIPSDLLTPVNEALNAIVQHGLQTALAEVEKTHYAYGHEVGTPYPEIALEP